MGKEKHKTYAVPVRMVPEVLEQVDKMAEEQRRTRSAMLRILLERGIEATLVSAPSGQIGALGD